MGYVGKQLETKLYDTYTKEEADSAFIEDGGTGTSLSLTDLTLSGGVYLGGTDAANHLDDYEEGTWTPTVAGLTLTTASGSYTKVGRQVIANYRINSGSTTDSATFDLGGLPFTPSNNTDVGRSAGYMTYNPSDIDCTQLFGSGGSTVNFRSTNSGSIQTITSFSGNIFWGTVVYYTA